MGNGRSTNRIAFSMREPQPLVAWLCQRALFLILTLALAACPFALGEVQPWAVGCLAAAVGLALMLWVVRILVENELRVVLSPAGVPLLAAAAYVVVRYALAELEPVARRELIVLVTALALYFLLLNNIRHRWQITVLMWMWVAVGAVVAAQGVVQVLGAPDGVWHLPHAVWSARPASGMFADPNQFAAYLALVFPVAAANFLFSRRSVTQKIMLGIGCLVMGAGLLVSQSMAGWLAWFGSCIVGGIYLVRIRTKKLRWAMVGIGALGAVVIVTALVLFVAREHTSVAAPDSPKQVLPIWRSAFAIARRNVLLGSGAGMFPWLFPTYRLVQGQPTDAHSEYLDLVAEYGLAGVALAVWIVAAFVSGSMRILGKRAKRYSASTPSNRYAFGVGGLAAVVAILLHGLFDCALHVPAILFTVAGLMAAVMNCGLHQRSGSDEEGDWEAGFYNPMRVSGFTRWVLGGALVAGLVCVTPPWMRTYAAEFCRWLGERELRQTHWSAAEDRFTQAWTYDKRNFEVATALGDLYTARATWDAAQRAALCRQAREWYQSGLGINPHAHDLEIRIARLFDALGQQRQAADRYEHALRADPFNAVFHVQLGLHQVRWGQTAEAIESFEEARDLGGADPLIEIQLTRLRAAPAPVAVTADEPPAATATP